MCFNYNQDCLPYSSLNTQGPQVEVNTSRESFYHQLEHSNSWLSKRSFLSMLISTSTKSTHSEFQWFMSPILCLLFVFVFLFCIDMSKDLSLVSVCCRSHLKSHLLQFHLLTPHGECAWRATHRLGEGVLLPSGSEQHEVLLFGSIKEGILQALH